MSIQITTSGDVKYNGTIENLKNVIDEYNKADYDKQCIISKGLADKLSVEYIPALASNASSGIEEMVSARQKVKTEGGKKRSTRKNKKSKKNTKKNKTRK